MRFRMIWFSVVYHLRQDTDSGFLHQRWHDPSTSIGATMTLAGFYLTTIYTLVWRYVILLSDLI